MKLRKLHSPLAILLITVVLISVVFLPGCRSSGLGAGTGTSADAPVSSSTDPQETSASPSETVLVPTQPVVEYITPTEYPEISTVGYNLQEPVLPIPAEDAPESEWIAFFYGLLSPENSWYNMALTSFYHSAEEIDTAELFYNGVYNGEAELTDEEIKFLSAGSSSFMEMDIYRIPAEELDGVLRIYFGTTRDAIETGKVSLPYFDQTDCYYQGVTGYSSEIIAGIVGYSRLPNGDYAVRYVRSRYEMIPMEVVLRRVNDYFQVISNYLADVKEPVQYPAISTSNYNMQPPVYTIPGEDASEEDWIAFFYGLLSTENSWYNLGLKMTNKNNCRLNEVFRSGVNPGADGVVLTEEEKELLAKQTSYFLDEKWFRMSTQEIDTVLQIYFGTTLTELREKKKDGEIETLIEPGYYLKETDCYYTRQANSFFDFGVLGIVNYHDLGDGYYYIQYATEAGAYKGVLLRLVDGYFQIIPN